MPFQLTPLKLVAGKNFGEVAHTLHDAMRLALLSTIKFEGDSTSSGMFTDLWAFMSPKGKRVMCVLGEQEDENGKVLHIRGDDKQLLLCLVGTMTSRYAFISALKPGLRPLHQEIFN